MLGVRRTFARFGVVVLAVAVLAAGWATMGASRAFAEGTFIELPGLNAAYYDDARGLIYLAHGCAIERYDVAAHTLRPNFFAGHPTATTPQAGIVDVALSPDGKTLAAADIFDYIDGADDGTTNHIWLIDAESGANHFIKFPQVGTSREVGTWAVQYGLDGKLLATSAYAPANWTPLRVVDPITGIVNSAATLTPFSDLCASGDGSSVGFALANAGDGPWGTYRVSDGSVSSHTGASGTSAYNYDIATNRDGSQYAVLANTTAYIYDADGTRRTVSGVLGAKYSPTADVLYMPQAYGTAINAYDTRTLSLIGSYNFEQVFNTSLGGSRGTPRLSVARDNSLLISLTQRGVRFTRMRPAVVGSVRSNYRGIPVPYATIEIWRQKSGTWSVEATTGANEWGSWTYTTDNTSAPIRVRVTDPSGINGPQWVGGADLTSASNLTPARLSAPSADVTLTVSAPAAITGTVRSSFKSRPVAGARVVLYDEAEGLSPVATATTDVNGLYSFSGLGGSHYRLGYTDPTGANLAGYYAASATLDSADSVVLGSPGTRVIDQTLTFVGYRVGGTVSSSFHGVPVKAALVEVWRDAGSGWAVEETLTASPTGAWQYVTDTTATVRFRAFDPSGVSDPTWYGGDSLDSAAQLRPAIPGDAPTAPIVMALAHPGAISGVVRSSSHGQTVGGIKVELHQDVTGYPVLATTTTAADGSYSFGSLGVTGYRVGFSDTTGAHESSFWNGKATLSAADVAAVSGPATTTADTTMTFVPTYVGGTLRSSWASKPVANATVELWRDTGAGWQLVQTAHSNSSGVWLASFETSDPVRAYFSDPSGEHDPAWYGGDDIDSAADLDPTRRTPVRVTTTLQLAHGATIVGTLRSSWKSQPIPGAVAALFYNDGSGMRSIAATHTAANGSYIFDDVGVGTVYIGFTDPSGAHLANDYVTSPLVTTVGGLLVDDVTLARIPSAVAGTVYSSFDSPDADNPNPPIASASIEVYREGVSGWALESTLTAGLDGSWRFQTPDPAPVRIHVADPMGLHASAWIGGTSLETAEDFEPTPTAFDPTQADATLDLTHPASFHGVLRDAVTGTRLKDFGVALIGATPDMPLVGWADTAADGSYAIDGIPAGSYYLAFMDEVDFRYDLQYYGGTTSPTGATVVQVTRPGEIVCDGLIKPNVVSGSFDDISIMNNTAEPAAGSEVDLVTALYDDQWGDPITDATVVLQSSTDRLKWGTLSVPVTSTPDGGYVATVTAGQPGACVFYRFAAPSDEFHKPAFSAATAINPRRAAYMFTETSEEGPDGWSPLTGMPTGIRARLVTAAGGPLGGMGVHLLSSADGLNFAESGVAVTDTGGGYYEADFSVASRVWIKLVWNSPDGAVCSVTGLVEPHVSTGAFFDRPGVDRLSAPVAVRYPGTPVTLTGNLRTRSASTSFGYVYLQTTADGLTWSNLSGAAMPYAYAYPLANPAPGTVWAAFPGATTNRTVRLAWVATDWNDAAASAPLSYQTYVVAGTPYCGSSQRAGRRFSITGRSSADRVQLVIERKSGSRWKYWGKITVNRPGSSPSYAYRVSTKVKAGSYRVYAVSLADAQHCQSPASKAKTFVCR